jgi:hypothetical protein
VPPIKTELEALDLLATCKTEAAFKKQQPRIIAWINETWLAPGNQEWAEQTTRAMWEQNDHWRMWANLTRRD